MIVKGIKQLGSFKKGVNIYVPKKKIVVPAAPSGIPVASTNQIRLTTTNSYYNSYAGNPYGIQPHEKKTNSIPGNDLVLTQGLGYYSAGYGNCYGNIVLAPNSILFSNWDGAVLVNAQNTWTFWQVKFSYGEESSGYFDASFLVATNPSTDSTTIPTAGWSSAITIVPSGIPVASTASFLILWATYIYSYNYRTMSRLEPNQTIDIGYASWNSGPNRNYRLESSYQIELIAPGNLSTIGGSAGYLISLNGPKNYWRLIRVSTNCSDGECDTNVEESINFTNFTNPEYFPDTGYPNGFSYTL